MRRGGKYLPDKIDDVDGQTIRRAVSLLYEMKRDTDRKRLGADVEIKVSK